jgi:hypothetical protein
MQILHAVIRAPPSGLYRNDTIMYICMKMEKWHLLENIPGMGEEEIKENDGGGEINCDIL